MANFGSFTEKDAYGAYGITFDWIIDSQSLLDNTTTIKVTVTLNSYYANGVKNSKSYLNLKIDGQQYGFTGIDYGLSGYSSKVIYTGTFVIPHEADGTKTFQYSFDASIPAVSETRTITGTSSGTLNPNLRGASITSATNFTDEQNPAIGYSNPFGENLDRLEACIADSKGNVIVPYREIDKTKISYLFNLTIDERNALRRAAGGSSLTVRFYIYSEFDGIETLKYLTRTMTLVDITPELNPVVRDVDTTIVALTGDNQKVIPGYSNIYFEIGVTPASGAPILTQSIRCGAQSTTTNNGTFIDAETNVIEFSVRDSRDNVALKTVEMETIPYIKVTCNQTVQLTLDGTVDLVVKGNYFADSFGKVDNTLSIQNRWRESGNEWSQWNILDPLISDISNNTYTLTATMSGFDPSGTYEFQSRAVDRLTIAESGVDSVVLKPIFDWSKNDFNFNVPLTIEGYPLADYVVETGTEAMGSNGTWYWEKWKSGKATCYGCRNYGNMAVTTNWGGLFRSEFFTQSYPSGLFKSVPESTSITLRQGSSGGWIVTHENSAPTAYSSGSFIVVRPAGATISQAYISFNVVGRWK